MQISSGGRKELLSRPKVCSCNSHWLSCTSVFRPGRFLVWRALTTCTREIRKACKLSSERPNVLGVLRRTVLLSSFYQQYRLVVLLAPKLNRLIHEPCNDLSQRFRGVI